MSVQAAINVKRILENSPSRITTHYHVPLKAYLSVDDTNTYIWCDVNEAWIACKRDLHNDELVLEFELLRSAGFRRLCGLSIEVDSECLALMQK